MAQDTIQAQIEQMSEALVFAEPSDMSALADLHTQFQGLQEWADESSMSEVAQAMAATARLIEGIILEELEDPKAALDTVSQALATVQGIVRDGRDPSEVPFPQGLRLAGQDASSAGSDTGAGQPSDIGPGGLVLSSVVDERILSEFVARQPSILEEMEALVLELEQGPDDAKAAELRRLIHTLKGESGLVGFSEIERVCHVSEDLMNDLGPEKMTDVLLSIKDWLALVFEAHCGQGEAPELGEVYVEQLAALREGGSPKAPQEVPQPEGVGETDAEAEAEGAAEPKILTGDPSLLSEFVTEAQEHLDNADVHLLTVETDPRNGEALNAVFRAFHTIKGVAGFLDLEDIQHLSHEAENLLDRARKGELDLEGPSMDVSFAAVDMMKRLVQHVAGSLASGEPMPAEPGLRDLIQRLAAVIEGGPLPPRMPDRPPPERLGEILVNEGIATQEQVEDAIEVQTAAWPEAIGELLVKEVLISRAQLEEALEAQRGSDEKKPLGEVLIGLGMVSQEDVDQVLRRQASSEKPKLGEVLVRTQNTPAREVAQALRTQQQRKMEVREAVRVDADRLDRLVDLIGEMVIAESMVSQSPELLGKASSQLSRQLNQLDKITRGLQEMGTSLRMVPIRATFQKMARLVRDLGKKSRKKVEFEMHGEDTELDKTVVDKIGDPLVHMVRNAVDHGLEATPEQRLAAGKSEAGHVKLRAFHKGGSIHVEIEDDGRGLDREAITNKAIERGIIREGDTLSDREIYNLIFEPGFSTAKQVTDVSGRGVGMDVVRRNIEALRGQVEIQSEKGTGSIFSIRLPLTLAIIDGMVVRVGRERYIIPTLSVVRSIRPESESLFSVVNQGEMLSLQDELIPMFRLDRLFHVSDGIQNPTEALVVIVEDDGRKAGILVDELLGQQQIVIKSLGETMKGTAGISGGAIMSDGRVGLILDVGGVVRLADGRANDGEATRAPTRVEDAATVEHRSS